MDPDRITPQWITSLAPHEVFVFGSNLAGQHGGGAARMALRWGARSGCGEGLAGSTYAIPTMQGGTETIRPYVERFLLFARAHPELRFLVTEVGCGIAGFRPDRIAPLFAGALPLGNVTLPASFWQVLDPSLTPTTR